MEILSAEADTTLLMDSSGGYREPGVHLSDILVRLAWERDKKYHPDAPMDYQMVEQGYTWERILEGALAARHGLRAGSRPKAIQEDGIWMSPDWIGQGEPYFEELDGITVLEEWKATKKSSKNLDQKLEEWAPQGMAYLRAALRRGWVNLPEVWWRVWCVMGDWSFEAKGDLNFFRDYYIVRVHFDERDLDENWQRIVTAGERFGLLKKEKPWEDRPSLNKRIAERVRKSGGSPPPKLRKPAPLVTFPSTRRTPRRDGTG